MMKNCESNSCHAENQGFLSNIEELNLVEQIDAFMQEHSPEYARDNYILQEIQAPSQEVVGLPGSHLLQAVQQPPQQRKFFSLQNSQIRLSLNRNI
jgi:hypothetical protein